VNEAEISDYVDAASALHGLAMGAEERGRVLGQFARIAAIAAPLLACELPPEVELAPVFRP
jgi:hypothetical protein